MDLRQLEALEAVLVGGSFTAAARRRHLSQPALWAQIKALEADLDMTLFVRVGRGVVPTASCLALRPTVRAALVHAAAVIASAKDIREGRLAAARIGCAPSHVPFFLADCIAALRKAHPESPFPVIVPISSATGPGALSRGEIDLLAEPWSVTHIPGIPLYRIWIAAIGPLVSRPRLSVTALHRQPVATFPKGTGLRDRLDQAARDAGVDLRIEYESRDPNALIALSRRKLCTAIVVSEVLDRRSLAESAPLTTEGRRFETQVWLKWRDDRTLSMAARQLRDIMQSEAKRSSVKRRPLVTPTCRSRSVRSR